MTDSSGNANHGKAPHFIKRGIEGLWNTKAVEFKGLPITVPNSQSLNNVQDQLTVETWVYLKAPQCEEKDHHKHWKVYPGCKDKPKFCPICWGKWDEGSLIHRPASYQLRIAHTHKAQFTLFIRENTHHHRVRKLEVKSNKIVTPNQWVHLAAVYTGDKLVLYVDGVQQQDQEQASGKVVKAHTPLFLGGLGFRGKLEEARVSNTARTQFGGGGMVTKVTQRSIYWNSWQVVEEREQAWVQGQAPGAEVVVRQFVDGAGIDEHLCMDLYNQDGTGIEKTYWYHTNARGDTVALSDSNGDVVLRLAYSPYGEAYKVNEQGGLEAFTDYESAGYLFQGRSIDEETGLYFFRHRQYDPQQGRFLSRDPMEYRDSMGLYEFGLSNPVMFNDPLGLQTEVWCYVLYISTPILGDPRCGECLYFCIKLARKFPSIPYPLGFYVMTFAGPCPPIVQWGDIKDFQKQVMPPTEPPLPEELPYDRKTTKIPGET